MDGGETFSAYHFDRSGVLVGVTLEVTKERAKVSGSLRRLLADTFRLNTKSVILSHSHPDHDPSPSPIDYVTAAQMTNALWLFGIRVHDNMVIADARHFSWREAALV